MTPSEQGLHPARRSTDHGRRQRGFQRLMARAARSWDPVVGGQLLLLITGILIVLTSPLLLPADWRSMSITVALVTVGAWLVSLLIPWQALPRKATVAFPIAAWTGLGLVGVGTHGGAGGWGALFTLWFAYLGLTHRSGSSLLVLPIAGGSYVAVWGGWSSPLAARLIVACAIWLVLAELLAALVSRQSILAEEMRQLAHMDTLTNLANRRDLDLRLAETGPGDAIILADLDHFKQLNDTLGHAAGDEVLTEFGLVVRTTLRQGDYAARFGGEEFVLVLPGTSLTEAAITLHRLRQRWAILRPDVTFSTGVAQRRTDAGTNETLAEADRALYEAKAAGRNRDHGPGGPLGTPPRSPGPVRQIA